MAEQALSSDWRNLQGAKKRRANKVIREQIERERERGVWGEEG